MKLYMVHCGFYETELFDGVFESHINFFVVAENFEEARNKAKLHPEFKRKRMHVDGLQEIQVIDGWKVQLEQAENLQGQNVVVSHRHRDLAPKATAVAK